MSLNVDAIVRQCKSEYDHGIEYRQGRVKDWQGTEDLYYGRVKKTLKGRFNIPVPIMSGFIDTLHSKIDDSPIIRFRPSEEADFRVTKKTQALYDRISTSEDSDLDSKDIDVKKLAIFSGRGTYKVYGESDPEFAFKTGPVDHYDFFADPRRGDLEDARFVGEDNVFKSKSQLIRGARSERYDKRSVAMLINGMVPNTIKDNQDRYRNKENRLFALGLTGSTNHFFGEGMERFIEQGTIWEGERYYVLWNYGTNIAIKCCPLKEVFKSNLWWYTSWATHRDPFNFWSKAPADDMRPIAETIKVLANQELDNRQKKNWGQRAYDPEIFPNGAELEWRPNGLVAVKLGSSKVTPISNGIYEFKTPDLEGTIDLVNWLDNMAGQKSGVTAAAQGQTEDVKVGIYQGNLQQVADRLGLYNKSYVKCHAAIGRRFVWACHEHLNKKEAVKLIGENGVEWDYLIGKEVNPKVDIIVESSSAEMQLNEAKKSKRSSAIAAINTNPELAKSVNKKWMLEQVLLNGDFDDEEVRIALDTETNGSREVMARASEAIQEIIKNKKPKLFRGATTGFQQKILDFATDNTDNDFALFQRLIAYSEAHNDIVMQNMSRRAMQTRAQQGMGLPPPSGAVPPGVPVEQPTEEIPMESMAPPTEPVPSMEV